MIAFLGGTFDPIHFGHLEAVKEIQQLNFFKKVSLLPSYQPVQKNNCLFDLDQRIEMIESALDEYPTIELDYDEINSKNPSYMIDTLRLKKSKNPDQSICLIIGTDALENLSSWKDSQELKEFCHLFVIERPKYPPNKINKCGFELVDSLDKLGQSRSGYLYFSDLKMLDISSTDIREKILNKRSIESLTPYSVTSKIASYGF
jgi:nicotinate-nucleotide adenylyltransferase